MALRAAMARGPAPEVAAMTLALRRAMRAYPRVTAAALDGLEHDLHVRLLSRCPNTELMEALQRTRCVLTLSKHVLGASEPPALAYIGER